MRSSGSTTAATCECMLRALPVVGHCYFSDDLCYATKTTASDRRADAKSENVMDGCFCGYYRRHGGNQMEILWRRPAKKKYIIYLIRRLGAYSDRNIVARRNASYGYFRTTRYYLFITRIENDYLKNVLLGTTVSPALLLDDRLRVNDWLAGCRGVRKVVCSGGVRGCA